MKKISIFIMLVLSSFSFLEKQDFSGKFLDIEKVKLHFHAIKPGMTKDEVRKILGEPHQSENNVWKYTGNGPVDLKKDSFRFNFLIIEFHRDLVKESSDESMDLLLPERYEMKKRK